MTVHGETKFRLDGIDHVALTVRDVRRSTRWYQELLGLERRHEEVWGDFPAVVCAGTTCLALFPVGVDEPAPPPGAGAIMMRHIAFRVDRANFVLAQAALRVHGVSFTIQDHTAAESIYFTDPDGHQLEITTYEVGRAK